MTILVTAIGSFSADCVISSLNQAGHKVIGCDIYPSEWHAVAKDCKAVYQVPLATTGEDYINALLKICRKHQIDFVFPLTDIEIDVLAPHRNRFAQACSGGLCIQSDETLRIARTKLTTCQFFWDDPLVNIPKFSESAHTPEDFPLPAIGKPVNGRSSEGLCIIQQQDELMRVKALPGYILQEKLTGSLFTVDYVRNAAQGTDVAIPRKELLRTKNGAGTTVKISCDSTLINMVSYIGRKLDVNGCINMEFILHEGNYYLIDINPRFSAGVAFSRMMGYDMVQAHLSCFTGETIPHAPALSQLIITKRYKEEIL